MRRKYNNGGLVCLSVSLDTPDRHAAALTFLTRVDAQMPNYLLDEDSDFWQTKWKFNGPPLVFVFDRQGKRAAKFEVDPDKPYDHTDVEARVKELLQQSP